MKKHAQISTTNSSRHQRLLKDKKKEKNSVRFVEKFFKKRDDSSICEVWDFASCGVEGIFNFFALSVTKTYIKVD